MLLDRTDVSFRYLLRPVRRASLHCAQVHLMHLYFRLLQKYPQHRAKMQAAGLAVSVAGITGAAFATKVQCIVVRLLSTYKNTDTLYCSHGIFS
jgi:hypothetical protein